MKLLFVINQFYKGGAESSLLNLLKKLDNTKYDIDLLVLNQCPVKNGVSLIEKVPDYVKVCDAYKEDKKFSLLNKLKKRMYLTEQQRKDAFLGAYSFVRNKVYDWAFHVGEWWTPDFLANEVVAKRKAAWIHTDLTKAVTFDEERFFSFDDTIDKYIFVSKRSLESCMDEYPFLRDKSECIYNILDTKDINEKSVEPIEEDYFDKGLPVILTCANLRQEKNHLRQLNAMAILKKRGVDFMWVNVGATSEKKRCEDLLHRAKDFGLEGRFIIAGPRDNPYRYMKKAAAVAVLSDYESWSMVITEAKILGTPVIATKTSGALEQIVDYETGILTDFTETDIADRIEEFLTTPKLQQKIRENTKNSDNTDEILRSFDNFVTNEAAPEKPKDILYVIDDVNYTSGAHTATKLQIKELLKDGINVSVFSSTTPNIKTRSEMLGVKFLSWRDFPENRLFVRRFFDCMRDKQLTKAEKKYKKRLTSTAKRHPNFDIFNKMVLPEISKLFSEYKTVCVMSESSAFRETVSKSEAKRKVQWIHTDYSEWREKTEWTAKITKNDKEIYSRFDYIVFLTDGIREGFVSLYPELREKAVVNKNIMPVDYITKKANRTIKCNGIKFVTVCRVDRYKGIDRMYDALAKLHSEGFEFSWTIVGGGEMLEKYTNMFEKSVLCDCVEFIGARTNPFPYVKDADVFALLSRYEGIPNTIYEALILGVPVLATDVGGISTQITPGENGWLVESSDGAIYEGIKHVLKNPDEIARYKNNLKNYRYDNEAVMNISKEILF